MKTSYIRSFFALSIIMAVACFAAPSSSQAGFLGVGSTFSDEHKDAAKEYLKLTISREAFSEAVKDQVATDTSISTLLPASFKAKHTEIMSSEGYDAFIKRATLKVCSAYSEKQLVKLNRFINENPWYVEGEKALTKEYSTIVADISKNVAKRAAAQAVIEK